MDPNETVKRLADLMSLRNPSADVIAEAAELTEALREWIAKGGFVPAGWTQTDDTW